MPTQDLLMALTLVFAATQHNTTFSLLDNRSAHKTDSKMIDFVSSQHNTK